MAALVSYHSAVLGLLLSLFTGCVSAGAPLHEAAYTAYLSAPAIAQPDTTKTLQAQQLFVRGMTYAQLGDRERALELFEKALELAPNEPAILASAAQAHSALGEQTSALFYAERAVDGAPENAYYRYQLAGLQRDADRKDQAVASLETLLQRTPDHEPALRMLAALYAEEGRSTDALSLYERALDQGGDALAIRQHMWPLLKELSDTTRLVRTLEAVIAQGPSDTAPYRQLGQLYLEQQRTSEAIAVLEQGQRQTPGDPDLDRLLADARRRLTDQPEDTAPAPAGQRAAADLLAEAERHLTVATAGDPEAAAQLLQTVLEREPGNGQAAELLRRALDQNPRDLERWHLAASAFVQSGQPAQALETAQEGLLLFPGQIPLLQVAGTAHLALDAPDKARAAFEEALVVLEEGSPDAPTSLRATLYERLGDALVAQNHLDEARQAWKKALALNPDNEALRDKLQQL